MPIGVSVKTEFLKQTAVCAEFTDHDLKKISEHCLLHKFSAGTLIFNENDNPDYFFIVHSGMVKIIKTEEDGSEIIVSLLNSGDCFGELAIIDNICRNAGAVALHDSELLKIEMRTFLDLVKKIPLFAFNLLKIHLKWLKEANELSRFLSLCSSEKTILNSLFRLGLKCGRVENNSLIIPPVMSHQEMANLAGTSRKNFTVILKNLEEKKILKRIGESREKMDIQIDNYRKIENLFR